MFFLLFILAVCNAEKFVVTGCAGYIGSHMSLELLEQGHTVIGVDNLSRGSNKALGPSLGLLCSNIKVVHLALETQF